VVEAAAANDSAAWASPPDCGPVVVTQSAIAHGPSSFDGTPWTLVDETFMATLTRLRDEQIGGSSLST
jgi:hypothetical protein